MARLGEYSFSGSESDSKPLGAPEEYLARIPTFTAVCEALEGIRLDLEDHCGLPAVKQSQKLTGRWLCPYHLETELHGMLGGEG